VDRMWSCRQLQIPDDLQLASSHRWCVQAGQCVRQVLLLETLHACLTQHSMVHTNG
jgi:hypothetical protein